MGQFDLLLDLVYSWTETSQNASNKLSICTFKHAKWVRKIFSVKSHLTLHPLVGNKQKLFMMSNIGNQLSAKLNRYAIPAI